MIHFAQILVFREMLGPVIYRIHPCSIHGWFSVVKGMLLPRSSLIFSGLILFNLGFRTSLGLESLCRLSRFLLIQYVGNHKVYFAPDSDVLGCRFIDFLIVSENAFDLI